jgi:hypothetical protein
MYISTGVMGLAALIVGVLLALFLPLGRARSNHLVSTLIIFGLFVGAGVLLFREMLGWQAALGIGAGLGLLAVLYRGLRRWLRYFQGAVYRATHPYYWYGRAWRGLFGGGRRARRRR